MPFRSPTHRPSRRSGALAVVLAVAVAPTLAACSDDDSAADTTTTTAAVTTTVATTTTTPPTTTAETTEPGDTTTTEPATSTDDLVPDGMSFGYVTEVNLDESTITIDIAELLTGDAAVKAAIEDGALEPGETSIDNDYYIRNKNPKVRVAPVAPDVTVKVLEDLGNPEAVDGTLEQFAANLSERTVLTSGMPVQIVAAGGVVSRIDEVFFP